LKLRPTTQHEVIAKEVANLLENYSYKKVPMGDSLSQIVFDNLLEGLDQGKNYLLQSDIDEFQQFKDHISQDFRDGDLSSAFYIFNTCTERYLQCMNYALEQVDATHDFTLDEEYTSFREDLDWFETEEDLRDQWRRRVDRKSTRLNSSHVKISYAVFCLKKKKCTSRATYKPISSIK